MGMRLINFSNGEYYHVFNRGVDKREIFLDKEDVLFFLKRLSDLNTQSQTRYDRIKRKRTGISDIEIEKQQKLVEYIAYCTLPNHFHLVLKQISENGITKLMQKLGTSYTMYFNKKYERSGSLFQGKFKSTYIQGNLSLPTIVTYVNLNYKHHGLSSSDTRIYSSLFQYVNDNRQGLLSSGFGPDCETELIISEIGTKNKFVAFMKETETIFIHSRKSDINEINWEEFEK